jgi:hypothetical protein
VREKTLERHRFNMLQPKALAYDLDPAGEYLKPGNSPPEQAFQVLKCSSDMVLYLADNAFPVPDRKIKNRGGKWVRQVFHLFGEPGTLILSHAVPALLATVGGRLSGDEPPELTADHHRRMYETVRSFYPLGKYRAGLIEQFLAEFTVMERHKPRKAVAEGTERANEYSQALMRGENPDDDPELVRMQQEYARDFFIDRAISRAIADSLSPNDRRLLLDKFVLFTTLSDSEAAEVRERNLRAWNEGSKPYLEYARLDAR